MRGVNDKNPELHYQLREGKPEVDDLVVCSICAAAVHERHVRHHEDWHNRLAQTLRKR